MKKQIQHLPRLAVLGLTALTFTGCSTVVRENIVSSIDTGFGVTVMENKQTQVPEIKVGYIRTQFYSVPTGKVVENQTYRKTRGTNGVTEIVGDHQTNRADITPEMVAGIRTESDFTSLILGLKISENFAIGSNAVNSDAATAMYIAAAKSDTNATAAAAAVEKRSAAMKGYSDTIAANHKTGNDLTDTARGRMDKITTPDQFKQSLKAATHSGILEEADAKPLADGLTAENLEARKTALKAYFRSSSDKRNQQFEKFNDYLNLISN